MPTPPAPPRPASIALPVIDASRCTGCGWCVPTCHAHLLTLQVHGPDARKTSTLHDPQDCTGCAKCAVRCPFDAITMVRRDRT
ncbi:ATP-binding protein [Leptothrix sp. BB-4]